MANRFSWSRYNPIFTGSVVDGFGPFADDEKATFGITSALYTPLLSTLNYPLGIILAFSKWMYATVLDALGSDEASSSEGASRLVSKATGFASHVLQSDWSMDGDEII